MLTALIVILLLLYGWLCHHKGYWSGFYAGCNGLAEAIDDERRSKRC